MPYLPMILVVVVVVLVAASCILHDSLTWAHVGRDDSHNGHRSLLEQPAQKDESSRRDDYDGISSLSSSQHSDRMECGAPEPSDEQAMWNTELVALYQRSRQANHHHQRQRQRQRRHLNAAASPASPRATATNHHHLPAVVIPVCFHVLQEHASSLTTTLTDEELQVQLDALNRAFSSLSCCNPLEDWCGGGETEHVKDHGGNTTTTTSTSAAASNHSCSVRTGFSFEMALLNEQPGGNYSHDDTAISSRTSTTLVGDDDDDRRPRCVTRVVQYDWYHAYKNSYDENHMKQTLRKGGPNILNIYYNNVGGVQGHATFPSSYAAEPELDGVVVRSVNVAGGPRSNRKEGDTLVHEVGHWLGLLHTFSGFSCTPAGGQGDGVFDTPRQAHSTSAHGCPVTKDSCGDDNGYDPVHNFMDYSHDSCRYKFTAGQSMLMHAQYELYRSPSSTGARSTIILEHGIPSEPVLLLLYEKQSFQMEIESSKRIVCSVVGDGNHNNLYMRLSEEPDIDMGEYGCAQTNGTFLSCTLQNTNDATSVWVSVVPDTSVAMLSVLCTDPQRAIALENGIPSTPTVLLVNETQIYQMPINDGQRVVCSVNNKGWAELYVRIGNEPDLNNGNYDCSVSYDRCHGCSPICVLGGHVNNATSVWVKVVASSSVAPLSVTCLAEDPTPLVELTSGVPSAPLTLYAGEEQLFNLTVKSDAAVTCKTAGQAGEANLYWRWDEAPDIDKYVYDCNGAGSYASKTCMQTHRNGATSVWAVVRASSNGPLTNFTLTCTTVNIERMATPIPLESGIVSAATEMHTSETRVFSLVVQPAATVSCRTSAATGDVDLFLRWGGQPDIFNSVYDCGSDYAGGAELCSAKSQGGDSTLWVSLMAIARAENVTINCTATLDVLKLSEGVRKDVSSMANGEAAYYSMKFDPSRTKAVVCALRGSDTDADADLYVRLGKTPDLRANIYDCSSTTTLQSAKECVVNTTAETTMVFAVVLATNYVSDVNLRCFGLSKAPPKSWTALSSGVSVDSIQLWSGETALYHLDVSPGDTGVTCALIGSNGNANLYVRWEAEPTKNLFDCSSTTIGSVESCSVSPTQDSTTLFVRVDAYSSFSGLSLTCVVSATSPSGTIPPVPVTPSAFVPDDPNAEPTLGGFGGSSTTQFPMTLTISAPAQREATSASSHQANFLRLLGCLLLLGAHNI